MVCLALRSIVHHVTQLFLGMANFVEWTLETRTQFIFTLFDEDRSGFLSMVRHTLLEHRV